MSQIDSKEKRDFLSNLMHNIYCCENESWNDQMVCHYAELFKQYYLNNGYNLYSSTYQWLTDAPEGTHDYLAERLGDIEAFLSKENYCRLREFIKLRDYVLLEACRANEFAEIKKIAVRGKQNLESVEQLKNDIQEDRKNTNTQSITVLSIFTGIAMAFFGGFSLLGSAFEALGKNKVPLPDIAIISLIIGFILFNTIFALISIACRISGVLPTQPDHSNCFECSRADRCDKKYPNNFLARWFLRFKRKYPYAFAVNAIIITLLFVLGIFSIIIRYKQ